MKDDDSSQRYITFPLKSKQIKASPEEAKFQYRSLKKGAAAEGRCPPLVGAAAGGRRVNNYISLNRLHFMTSGPLLVHVFFVIFHYLFYVFFVIF